MSVSKNANYSWKVTGIIFRMMTERLMGKNHYASLKTF